jgi:hypothetical protein
VNDRDLSLDGNTKQKASVRKHRSIKRIGQCILEVRYDLKCYNAYDRKDGKERKGRKGLTFVPSLIIMNY